METKHFDQKEPEGQKMKKVSMLLMVLIVSGIGTPFMLNTVFGCHYVFTWRTILAFILLPVIVKYLRNYLR